MCACFCVCVCDNHTKTHTYVGRRALCIFGGGVDLGHTLRESARSHCKTIEQIDLQKMTHTHAWAYGKLARQSAVLFHLDDRLFVSAHVCVSDIHMQKSRKPAHE